MSFKLINQSGLQKSNHYSFKNITSKIVCILALSIFSFVSILSLPTQAQTAGGRGIVITPAVLELEVDKNLPYNLSVNLENDSIDDNINLTPKIYTFDSVKDDGTPNVKSIDEKSLQNGWVKFELIGK